MNMKLNVGQMVQTAISALLIFVVSNSFGKMDKFSTQLEALNVHFARLSERSSFQDKRDADQDHRLDIQRKHIDDLSALLNKQQKAAQAAAAD